jgi:hypothetical protein
MKEDTKKAEARNVYADDLCKLAHRCLQREDGEIKGFDMKMFESLSEIIIKASNESYASLREAQAVANYKERVKAKVDTAGWSMLSPMLTPYQTEDVMNQIKELLDTTN